MIYSTTSLLPQPSKTRHCYHIHPKMVRPWKPCLVLATPAVAFSSQTDDTTLATVTSDSSSTNGNTTMSPLSTAPLTGIQNNGTNLDTVASARSTAENMTMPPPAPAPLTKIRTVTTKVATSTSTIWPKPDPTPVNPSTKDCYDRWDLCRGACLIFSWFTMGISCCEFSSCRERASFCCLAHGWGFFSRESLLTFV